LTGPPFPWKPILLAGTVRQYSKKAIPHEKRITRMRGHPVLIFISLSFRCPYQANVMKTLDATSISIVQIPFIFLLSKSLIPKKFPGTGNMRLFQ
jgi:hypothetical protein